MYYESQILNQNGIITESNVNLSQGRIFDLAAHAPIEFLVAADLAASQNKGRM